jgi:hypothetical protein
VVLTIVVKAARRGKATDPLLPFYAIRRKARRHLSNIQKQTIKIEYIGI